MSLASRKGLLKVAVEEREVQTARSSLAIPVVGGVGEGVTLLSSFDAALRQCGVYNYNLITLSSVIPPGSKVARADRFESPPDQHGHRLYVVKADQRSSRCGDGIAAGVGWQQWGDGRGVFVEHETTARSAEEARQEVERSIRDSLQDLCRFREIPFDEAAFGCKIVAADVADRPMSVIVMAVFNTEGWA
jgi:arginine decarboxylase